MQARDLIARVEAAIRKVATEVLEPRFGNLEGLEVTTKSPGELVTTVDREAETELSAHLAGIAPVPVVGEEACSEDPSLAAALSTGKSWLVDPLDGTANFVAGSTDWAVMVALVDHGATVASWIYQPVSQTMYVAERGAGASRNGQQITAGPRPPEASRLRGAVLTRFMDPVTAARVRTNAARFAAVTPGRHCSGIEYPAVVEGHQDFVVFWRTLPWDHAPGALLAEEAGGRALRPDGSAYRADGSGVGLITAADRLTWSRARSLLDP